MKRTSLSGLLSLVLIAAAAFLVYGASLGNGFVDWDDPQLIFENSLIRSFSPKIFSSYDPELYIPLTLPRSSDQEKVDVCSYILDHGADSFLALVEEETGFKAILHPHQPTLSISSRNAS